MRKLPGILFFVAALSLGNQDPIYKKLKTKGATDAEIEILRKEHHEKFEKIRELHKRCEAEGLSPKACKLKYPPTK